MVILCFLCVLVGYMAYSICSAEGFFSPGAGYMLYARRDFLHLTDKELLLYADEPKKGGRGTMSGPPFTIGA